MFGFIKKTLNRKRTKAYAIEHHAVFLKILKLYKNDDFQSVIKEGEKWLLKFPNYQTGRNYVYSDNPKDLTIKNYVWFSNEIYMCMSISAFIVKDYKKSIHYRCCMGESVRLSDHSGCSSALAWRLLNLSIRRDSRQFNYPEYLTKIRTIDETELSNAGNDGLYVWDAPKTKINWKNSIITVAYPEETIKIDFKTDRGIKEMFDNISEWILVQENNFDWSFNGCFDNEWLSLLDGANH